MLKNFFEITKFLYLFTKMIPLKFNFNAFKNFIFKNHAIFGLFWLKLYFSKFVPLCPRLIFVILIIPFTMFFVWYFYNHSFTVDVRNPIVPFGKPNEI